MATSNLLIQRTSHKIWLFNTLIVSGVLICFGIVVMGIYSATLFKNTDRQLFELALQLNRIPDFISPENNKNAKMPFEMMPPPTARNLITIVYKGEEVLYYNPNPFFDGHTLPALEYTDPIKVQNFSVEGYRFRAIVVKDTKAGLTYELITNVDNLIHAKENLQETLIVSSFILILLSSLIGFLMAKRAMGPIEKNYNEQVRFVQDASHEMRTPLAVLQGKLELIAKSQGDAIESHLSSLSQMMTEIKNLEKLTNDLLQLSKLDLMSTLTLTDVQVNAFLKDVSLYYNDLAEYQEKGFKINSLSQETVVSWDLAKVKRMVSILLENAFKYTHEGDTVALSATLRGKFVVLSVEDNGIGISEEDQPFIFERFYRSPSARASTVDGSGIGLSLLKAITDQIGVVVELESQLGRGTIFTLSIPCQINTGEHRVRPPLIKTFSRS